MLKKVETYIEKHNLDTTPEQMFVEFEHVFQLHKEYNNFLKESDMKRSDKSIEKRKLFVEWYFKKFQDSKMIKELLIELSDIAFVTPRTIERDLTSDTTERGL